MEAMRDLSAKRIPGSWRLTVAVIASGIVFLGLSLFLAGSGVAYGMQNHPAMPTGLTVAASDHQSVSLTWDDPADSSITGYQILRRSRDGDTYKDGRGAAAFVVIDNDTGSAANFYVDTGVTPRTRYVYRIKARIGDSLSRRSSYANAETAAPPADLSPVSAQQVQSNPSISRITSDLAFNTYSPFCAGTCTISPSQSSRIPATWNGIIPIKLIFSEAVTVAGTPTLTLSGDNSSFSGTADYASGSGSTTLVFNYTIPAPPAAGVQTDNLNVASVNLPTSADTITDADGNNATLSIPSGQNLADGKDINVDSVGVQILVVTTSGNYNGGNAIGNHIGENIDGSGATVWLGNKKLYFISHKVGDPTQIEYNRRTWAQKEITDNSVTTCDASTFAGVNNISDANANSLFEGLYTSTRNGHKHCMTNSDNYGNRGFGMAYIRGIDREAPTITVSSLDSASRVRAVMEDPFCGGKLESGLPDDRRTDGHYTQCSGVNPDQVYALAIGSSADCDADAYDGATLTDHAYTSDDPILVPDGKKLCFRAHDYSNARFNDGFGQVAYAASAVGVDVTGPTITIAETTTNGERVLTASSTASDLDSNSWIHKVIGAGDDCDAATMGSGTTAGNSITLDNEAYNGQKVCFAAQDDSSNFGYAASATISGINYPATGRPTITGSARVGQTLRANTTNIADTDGLVGVSYSYQWIRVDSDSSETDIPGATSSTYQPVLANAGKALKVRVSFTDAEGNAESLTSLATATVRTGIPAPTGLAATATETSVTLTWDDPADSSITGYQILRRPRDRDSYGDGLGSTQFLLVTNDTGNADTSYVDISVSPRTRYVYRVIPRDSGGLGAVSAVNVETPRATHAEMVLLSTRSDASDSSFTVSSSDDRAAWAQPFVTGQNPAGYRLSGINIRLDNPSTGASVSADIRAEDNENAGRPGDLLVSLTAPATLMSGWQSLTVPTGTLLPPGTTYFLVITVTNGSVTMPYPVTPSAANPSVIEAGRWHTSNGLWEYDPLSHFIDPFAGRWFFNSDRHAFYFDMTGARLPSQTLKSDPQADSDADSISQAFVTGDAEWGYVLESAEIDLSEGGGSDTVRVEIHRDDNGRPGGRVHTIYGLRRFSHGTNVFRGPRAPRIAHLMPDTTYHLVATATKGSFDVDSVSWFGPDHGRSSLDLTTSGDSLIRRPNSGGWTGTGTHLKLIIAGRPMTANDTPVIVSSPSTVSVAENLPAGTVVATVEAFPGNLDFEIHHTYLEVVPTGTDGRTVEIRTIKPFDYENRSSYRFVVYVKSAAASYKAQKTITLNVDDVDEPTVVSYVVTPRPPRHDRPIYAAVSDPDGDFRVIGYQWQNNFLSPFAGDYHRGWGNIRGATGSSYRPNTRSVFRDWGATLRVAIEVEDKFGRRTVYSPPTEKALHPDLFDLQYEPGSRHLAAGGSIKSVIGSNFEHDTFTITLRAGKKYRLDMMGASSGGGDLVDPYLEGLWQGGSASWYEPISGQGSSGQYYNDDAGVGHDARMFFEVREAGATDGRHWPAGTYSFRASGVSAGSSRDSTGTYTVRLTELRDDIVGVYSGTLYERLLDDEQVIYGPTTVSGRIDFPGDTDLFNFLIPTPSSTRMRVRVEAVGDLSAGYYPVVSMRTQNSQKPIPLRRVGCCTYETTGPYSGNDRAVQIVISSAGGPKNSRQHQPLGSYQIHLEHF